MHTLTLLKIAARPKTLFASISPVLIASALAMSAGAFSLWVFFLTLSTALLIQISTNVSNDYFDALKGSDSKERIGPLRLTNSGLVSKSWMKKTMLISFALATFFCSLLSMMGGPVVAVFLGISLILALIYTAGPYPLAYLGLGEVFVFIFFGPIATMGTYFMQTKGLSFDSFFAGLIPGSFSTAILVVNNLRDVHQDLAANKKTLASRFGDPFSKKEYLYALMLPYLITSMMAGFYPFLLIVFITLPIAIKLGLSVMKNEDKKELNLILGKTAQLLVIFSVLFCIGRMVHS
jgi:1,4-dihydroxy-2-naphthoate polyprenyltransferase